MIDLIVFFAFLGLLVWVGFRHAHRWAAWSDPIDQTTGSPIQTRRCKDAHCNEWRARRVRP